MQRCHVQQGMLCRACCVATRQQRLSICCCRPVCLWVLLLLLPGAQRHVRVHADVLLLWVHVHGLLCVLPHAGCSRLQIIPHFCTAYLQVSNCDIGCTAVSSAIHVSLMRHLLSQMGPGLEGLCAISISCQDHIAGRTILQAFPCLVCDVHNGIANGQAIELRISGEMVS